MSLQRIRVDTCLLDERFPLHRFELLECGCVGRRLTRLMPRFPGPRTLAPSDAQLAWLHSWPIDPVHALIELPGANYLPATRRRCDCLAPRPTYLAAAPLVLHAPGESCADCQRLPSAEGIEAALAALRAAT